MAFPQAGLTSLRRAPRQARPTFQESFTAGIVQQNQAQAASELSLIRQRQLAEIMEEAAGRKIKATPAFTESVSQLLVPGIDLTEPGPKRALASVFAVDPVMAGNVVERIQEMQLAAQRAQVKARGIPPSQARIFAEALPDSPEKTALLGELDAADPSSLLDAVSFNTTLQNIRQLDVSRTGAAIRMDANQIRREQLELQRQTAALTARLRERGIVVDEGRLQLAQDKFIEELKKGGFASPQQAIATYRGLLENYMSAGIADLNSADASQAFGIAAIMAAEAERIRSEEGLTPAQAYQAVIDRYNLAPIKISPGQRVSELYQRIRGRAPETGPRTAVEAQAATGTTAQPPPAPVAPPAPPAQGAQAEQPTQATQERQMEAAAYEFERTLGPEDPIILEDLQEALRKKGFSPSLEETRQLAERLFGGG